MGATAEFLRVPVPTLTALQEQPEDIEQFLIGDALAEVKVTLDGRTYWMPKYAFKACDQLPGPRRIKALRWNRRRGLLRPVEDGELKAPAAGPKRPRTRPVNIEKAWHGLHYLLCGRAKRVRGPADIILGGRPIGANLGYGPCRFLTAQQVRAGSVALARCSITDLGARFSPARLRKANVYPGEWDEGDLEYLLNAFRVIRTYFANAAQRGEAMLVYLV